MAGQMNKFCSSFRSAVSRLDSMSVVRWGAGIPRTCKENRKLFVLDDLGKLYNIVT